MAAGLFLLLYGETAGDWSLFLFSPLPCLDTGSSSLLATSSSSDTVSLLMVVVSMGVPLMCVLKTLALLTLRLVNSAELCHWHLYYP